MPKSGRCLTDYLCIGADDFSASQSSDDGLRSSVEEARVDVVERDPQGVDHFVEGRA